MQSPAGEAIRARLRKARTDLQLTQEQVAQEMGVKRQTISKWESGKGAPNPREMAELCMLYGVTTDWVLTGTPSVPATRSKLLQKILKPRDDFADSER